MEKKVIITLWGPQDTGKTTTLRKLAQEFLESPDVKEDIQIGFLVGEKKIVVSTAKDDQVNTSFCEELDAHALVTATRAKEPGEECAQRIIVDTKPIKKDNTGSEQEQVTKQEEQITKQEKEISKLIEPIAMQNEITTLRQFSLKLLKSDVVKGDIQIAFHYKGKRILISTAGDNKKVVDESTRLFDSVGADMLITAISAEIPAKDAPEEPSKRTMRTQLEKYKKSISKDVVVDLKWKPKVCATSVQEQINEEQAKVIKSIIDQIITDWEKKPKGNSASSDPVSE